MDRISKPRLARVTVAAQPVAVATNFTLTLRNDRIYLRGDFDGDGKPDYAVAVKSKACRPANCGS